MAPGLADFCWRVPKIPHPLLLLGDSPVGSHGQGVSWFVAIAGRRGVLDQPDIIRKHISCNRSRCIFITRVLIVDSERKTGTDRYIAERDLVPVWRDRLQRHAGEVPPARMNVRRPDAGDASLRGSW